MIMLDGAPIEAGHYWFRGILQIGTYGYDYDEPVWADPEQGEVVLLNQNDIFSLSDFHGVWWRIDPPLDTPAQKE